MGVGDVENRDCGVCGKAITGQAMKAKGRLYHEDTCFKCTTCSKDLRQVAVYAKDAALYCEEHYKANFVPKCAKCKDYITEDCVRALNRTWHSEHFACVGCGLNFSTADVGYHEHNGQAYCEPCYNNTVLPKCKGCNTPITDRTMKAMGGQWHVSCFVCKDCKTTFEGQKSFYAIDDLPVCGPCAGIGEVQPI